MSLWSWAVKLEGLAGEIRWESTVSPSAASGSPGLCFRCLLVARGTAGAWVGGVLSSFLWPGWAPQGQTAKSTVVSVLVGTWVPNTLRPVKGAAGASSSISLSAKSPPPFVRGTCSWHSLLPILAGLSQATVVPHARSWGERGLSPVPTAQHLPHLSDAG